MKTIYEDNKLVHEFCCDAMNWIIQNKCGLNYNPVFRSYTVPTEANNEGDEFNLAVFYCPRCGTKLPKELRDEWEDILYEEYGISADVSDISNITIPKEFKSDAWWKKRGL